MGEHCIRFVSIDDHPSISEAIGGAAEETTDLRMLRSFTSIEAVPLPLRDESVVDVVLLDLSLPGQRGLAAVREVSRWGPRLLVFSATAVRRQVDEAMLSGAQGFISKALPTAAVLDSIRAVYRGDRLVSGVQLEAGPLVHFTSTETKLLELICQDSRSAPLARSLGISSRTVDNMIADLYTKIGLEGDDRSRPALRDWARDRGYERN